MIDQNPKFIALVEQNLNLNGEFQDYYFVYSSKHNFFKFIIEEVDNKNFILGKVSFLKTKVSVPEEIDDKNITENEFLESVLDHCKYSSLKNIKEQVSKKKLVFKKFDVCKIKFLNSKNLNDFTIEKFKKAENINVDNEDENNKKQTNNVKKEKKTSKKIFNKKISISFLWQRLPYPLLANLEMKTENTGVLNIFLHETEDNCVGTIALNSDQTGSWSLSCPDNISRKGKFKKKLGASGNLSIENNRLIANGYDNFRNKGKFVSDIINE